jgi:hypothetical protein
MRRPLCLLAATVAAVAAIPSAADPESGMPNPYRCRSAAAGTFWFGGVESDACDGPLPDGTFGGEAITGLDPDGTINLTSGPVLWCTVQLDRVVDGRAVPVPGATVTQSGQDPEYFDGRFCDAMATWASLPAGLYAITAAYRTASGTAVQRVQGPVFHT